MPEANCGVAKERNRMDGWKMKVSISIMDEVRVHNFDFKTLKNKRVDCVYLLEVIRNESMLATAA